MYKNACLIYGNVNEVYQNLILFCQSKGFKVKESNEKYYFIRSKKTSIFFWRTMRLELEIQAVEKDQVEVTTMLYKFGIRQLKSENEYTILIESFLDRSNDR